MAVNPSALGVKPQFVLSSGLPAVGAQLFFYVGGSVGTKQNTYTDSTGSTPNANPIVLNSLGEPSTQIWLQIGQLYKVVYAPAGDTDPPTSPIWTIDNLSASASGVSTFDEWVSSGITPTYVNATTFTLPGDQTNEFAIGRRIKTSITAGTGYHTIVNSVFGALTTVTVVGTALDAGLSAVSYGILRPANRSIPGAQSSVLATLISNLNVTGAGGVVTNFTNVEAYDTYGDYVLATGVFTARRTGPHLCTISLTLQQLGVANTTGELTLITTARNYPVHSGNYGTMMSAVNELAVNASPVAFMTAGDTASWQLIVSNGAGNTVDIANVRVTFDALFLPS